MNEVPQKLVAIYQALETIKVSGAKDCTTLSNCFSAIETLIKEIREDESDGVRQ